MSENIGKLTTPSGEGASIEVLENNTININNTLFHDGKTLFTRIDENPRGEEQTYFPDVANDDSNALGYWNKLFIANDRNGNNLCAIEMAQEHLIDYDAKYNSIKLITYNPLSTIEDNLAILAVVYGNDGNKYVSIPVPKNNATSHEAVTASWVRTYSKLGVRAYCHWNSTSGFVFSNGIAAVTHQSNGLYYVTFTQPITEYTVHVTAEVGGNASEIIGVYGINSAGFNIDVSNYSGVANDVEYLLITVFSQ